MDALKLQEKIYSGYAKAAQRIGLTNTVYRATSEIAAMGQTVTSIYASFNSEDMTYSRPNKYGKPTWFGVFDGTLVKVGDYLIGQQGTFFVAQMQLTLPILMVQCNRTVNFLRALAPAGVGALEYGGATAETDQVLMSGWPASILQGSKGEKGDAILPGDVKTPWWNVLLPAYPGVILRSSDIMTDDLGRRYTISSAELTDAGWRLTAMQAVT